MKQHKQAIQWAEDYLISHENSCIVNRHIVVETAWSVVYKIETTQRVIYLKQVPKAMFLEPDILTFLHHQGCQNIPALLGVNPDLHCFMMSACGTVSLRHLFNGKVNFDLLKTGLIAYSNIQRSMENKTQQLLLLDIPDWRLDKFSFLYDTLIQQEELLRDEGLTEKEIARLHRLSPRCKDLCETLSKYDIPQTISHCDFQDNNMVLDEQKGAINIIDWGETVIAHPFVSLNQCLWNMTYFNKMKETDSMYKQLQKQCVAPWLNLYDEEKLLELFHMTNQLLGIYAALEYERLYVATQNNHPKTVQQDKHGSIAGCLRTFLSSQKS